MIKLYRVRIVELFQKPKILTRTELHPMIRLFCVLLIVIQPFILFSQRKLKKDSLYIDTVQLEGSINRLKHNKTDSLKHFAHDSAMDKIKDPLYHIQNVGFRFIVRELAADFAPQKHQTDSVRNAVNTLLNYVGNDSIRSMVFYLKDYIEKRKTEEALREVKKQIELEKVLSYQPDLPAVTETESMTWRTEALNELYKYVEDDPVHQWIREISRDSVFLGVRNYMNDSVKFWINNGKQDYKRFWLKKNKRDSIGIWLQNTSDKSIRILVDDDVYQQSVQRTKVRGTRVILESQDRVDQYKLAKLGKYKRYSQIWNVGAIVGLSFNQGHVSDSWSRGGESSIATASTLDAFANYKNGKHTWDNSLKVKYGLIKSGDNGFRKNEDLVELNTKYGQKAVKNWYYSAQFNLKTQMVKGYTYSTSGRNLKSNFFAPAYIIASIGMDYKPNKNLSVLLSPLSSKYTIVRDTANIDQTAFGVDKDKKVKKEIGSYVNISYDLKFWHDLELKNKLTLYSNYSKKPKNVDVDWELSLVMPINQYLSSKVSTHLISDDDTGSKVQFKENFSIGVSYRF
jgi:flagellar biosynthesis regulator FlbT